MKITRRQLRRIIRENIEVAQAREYDRLKEETANRFSETDAIDEVMSDLQSEAMASPEIQGILEEVEEAAGYDEPLNYILSLIPDEIKTLLMRQ